MTLTEWRAEVNRLVTETFQIGRREWREHHQDAPREYNWSTHEEMIRSEAAEFGWRVQERLVPLDFCGSLDAVRQVEDTLTPIWRWSYVCTVVGQVQREIGKTHEELTCAAYSTAEQRAVALLRWRGVAVPERPTGEQE